MYPMLTLETEIINQTMYETFFSCIGILIGFLQVFIFQFALEKPENRSETLTAKLVRFFVIIVQELLLLAFFFSLIYIYFYGTYVARVTDSALSGFHNYIHDLISSFNIVVLGCIALIFIVNCLLFINEFNFEKGNYKIIKVVIAIIVVFGLSVFFSCLIYETTRTPSLHFKEQSSIIELLITRTQCKI